MSNYTKSRWVIIKDNKIFLVKETWTWKFMLPGWTQEKDETIKETFYREMKEETWIDAVLWKFLWFKEYINSLWTTTIQFLFLVKNVDDFENIDKSKCSHWFEWSEAWFYNIKELKEKNEDIPSDLEEIYSTTLFEKEYKYLI